MPQKAGEFRRWLARFDCTEEEWDKLHRHWLIAVVAQRYNVTPLAAARELDRDPERLALRLLPLYRYADAQATAERTKDWTKLADYRDQDIMQHVIANAHWAKHEAVHPEWVEDCEECELRSANERRNA